MHPQKLPGLKKKNRGTTEKAFHLTGMNNVADLAESSSSSSDDETPALKTIQSPGKASFLGALLDEVKKAGEVVEINGAKRLGKAKDMILPAEQFANLQNILATFGKNHNSIQERDYWERERVRHLTFPIDINSRPNDSKEPVYYRPSSSTPKAVARVPYLVSDIIKTCNRCTYHQKCERHRERVWQKTDVSLCNKSHLRMVLSWDVTDPENQKGTWQLDIQDKYNRFAYPKEEREHHERAQSAKRRAQDDGKDVSVHEQGCCPSDPKWRIKELARRVIEDYNSEAKILARREILDPKGREYFTKPYHWGGKDPFTPSESSRTRATRQYVPSDVDSNKVERELRVLLQAWHKSQLPPQERMSDRTTANMKDVWAQKMEEKKDARMLRSATAAAVKVDSKRPVRELQAEPIDRYKMTTWDRRKLESSHEPKAVMKTATSRKFTAEERNTLAKISKAAEMEVEETAEMEARTAKAEGLDFDPEEYEVASLVDEPMKVTMKPSTIERAVIAVKSAKRKATATLDDMKSNKKYKSADIVVDSDEEANYQLPAAPLLELPEQREGWEFAEALSHEITDAVKVVQSDDATELKQTAVVVEQGTTIIKEIETEISDTIKDETAAKSPSAPCPLPHLPTEALTPPPYCSPTPSPPNTPLLPSSGKKRANPFDESSGSDGEDSSPSSPSRKKKRVRFSVEYMSPVQAPRMVSMVHARNGEEGDDRDGE